MVSCSCIRTYNFPPSPSVTLAYFLSFVGRVDRVRRRYCSRALVKYCTRSVTVEAKFTRGVEERKRGSEKEREEGKGTHTIL